MGNEGQSRNSGKVIHFCVGCLYSTHCLPVGKEDFILEHLFRCKDCGGWQMVFDTGEDVMIAQKLPNCMNDKPIIAELEDLVNVARGPCRFCDDPNDGGDNVHRMQQLEDWKTYKKRGGDGSWNFSYEPQVVPQIVINDSALNKLCLPEDDDEGK